MNMLRAIFPERVRQDHPRPSRDSAPAFAASFLAKLRCVATLSALASLMLACNDPADYQPLFSSIVLGPRFGTFTPQRSAFHTSILERFPGGAHAEAQIQGVLGTDFRYSSVITLARGGEAHLQFRVSSEGRYGVGVSAAGMHLYKFQREGRATPLSPELADQQIFHELQFVRFGASEHVPHQLVVAAAGRHFTASLDGASVIDFVESTATPLDVGHFGIYVVAPDTAAIGTTFEQIAATANVLAPTNFALLFSTGGYDVHSTMRALVRSIDPVAGSAGLDLARSSFSVLAADGSTVLTGSLGALPRSFGMDLWEVNMQHLTTPGIYRLKVNLIADGVTQTLASEPFEVGSQAFTRRMLPSMTFVNAESRSAADHDFANYWSAAGAVPFSVTTAGELKVRDADDGFGSLLTRTRDAWAHSAARVTNASTFGYAGTVTIDSGCDAQLQFLVNKSDRYAVTLQAGAGGHCAHGAGPGAIRLHEEGPHAPDGFRTLASQYLPAPFVAGRPYDLIVRVGGGTLDVYLDGAHLLGPIGLDPNMPTHGSFAVKAWGSSARFDHVQAWTDAISVVRVGPGVFEPFLQGQSCSQIFQQSGDSNTAPSSDTVQACTPIFIQRHGYHDCNNYIGEADSHGAFLSGLMDVWTKRAGALADSERERLRRAILRGYVYLNGLAQHGAQGTKGRLDHEEFGRGGIEGNGAVFQTVDGIYGLGAFAARGTDVNAGLARAACVTLLQSVQWLETQAWDDEAKALAYLELEQCARREGFLDATTLRGLALRAQAAVSCRLANLSGDSARCGPGTSVVTISRDTGRMIPWLEGVYELKRTHPELWTSDFTHDATTIAALIVARLDPANGFRVIPQASGVDPAVAWNDMSGVPSPRRPASDENPRLDWYNVTHFATTAVDAAYLQLLTPGDALEPLASASLEWITGLNPGIPSTRVTSPGGSNLAPSGGSVWRSAAFIENFDSAFARGYEAIRTADNDQKTWLWPWEPSRSSAHLEAWLFSPKQQSFMSIVNGHVLRDGQWDYWNQGTNGWASGETFLLFDGIFSKASLLYEAWRDGAPEQPLDTSRTNFFDTTTLDRGATAWSFEDVNLVAPAQALRLAHDFCTSKGFAGGAFSGHEVGELEGVLCFPRSSGSFDVTNAAVSATGFPIVDLDTAPWPTAAGAASVLCANAGYAGGVFNGYQSAANRTRHVVCVAPANGAVTLDAGLTELARDGFTGPLMQTAWAVASRAFTNFCVRRGYRGGFFNGATTAYGYRAVCLK